MTLAGLRGPRALPARLSQSVLLRNTTVRADVVTVTTAIVAITLIIITVTSQS